VTAETVRLSIYSGILKPSFTYGDSGNSAETTFTEAVAEIQWASI